MFEICSIHLGESMNPRANQCLETLSEIDYELLRPHLKLMSLSVGESLNEALSRPHKLYFPVNALIALRKDTPDGLSIDTATIGAEGLLGLSGLTGNSFFHTIVAEPGLVYALDSSHMLHLIDLHPMITKMCMRAAQLVIRKISMELLCNHYHQIQQRLSRWILTRHDYLLADSLTVTHQAISDSLGIRREAVSLALAHLAGVSVSRGHLDITNRTVLEHQSCECYFQLKQVHPNQISLAF
jgi:CRP-like cAMP-binding protein